MIYAFALPARLTPPTTCAAATVLHALYASRQLRLAAGASPDSLPSSLIAAGGTTRRCDFPTFTKASWRCPAPTHSYRELRVSHNRKKAQEYNERYSALALFSVLCPYVAALGHPLGRRGGGGQAVALLLRTACAGDRHVGASRGGFVTSSPFGRAYAADKSAAFLKRPARPNL